LGYCGARKPARSRRVKKSFRAHGPHLRQLSLKRRAQSSALTIAGSDSGGGAGIQADLKTFAALGVHGTSVITCLTAQNPSTVLAIQPVTPQFVGQQLSAVFAALPPRAIKIGMLFSAEVIELLTDLFSKLRARIPLIVDPVMIATSGARLLEQDAVNVLRTRLLPLASLVTPNVPEAAALAGCSINEPEDLRAAARRLHSEFGCAVLLKGGHLPHIDQAIDIFYDGRAELLLSAPFVRGVSTHGTGCTYSAAITGFCAQGRSLVQAVELAKKYITKAIANSTRVGRHDVLGW
jgi:hydroxymethylpyrimidine/phosphomethylpyrimidine kinase